MMSKRASSTSQKLAALVLMAETCPQWQQILPPAWPPAQRERLTELGLYPRLRFKLYERRWYQQAILFLDRWLLDSQLVYMILRKRFFAEQVRVEIEKGAQQVVILGAGIDPAGIQYATAYPQVQVWEIDRADLLSSEYDLQRPDNLHRITTDLTQPRWYQTLTNQLDWRCDVPTVFMAEGLLMYLTEKAVRSLFRSLKQLSPEQGSLYFGYLRSTASGRPSYGRHSWLVRLGLWCVGEPLLWSLNPEQLDVFLQSEGLTSTLAPDETNLHRRFLRETHHGDRFPPPSIEFMADARWGRGSTDAASRSRLS
jgi:methyltransferase (TIGR00027 family)